ncbi:MAG: glycine/sarcosine/betaine reductase selenoprotein B family protein [Alphaproteobacteria bacterium]
MDYVRYIDRTTAYYRSQGYEQDYAWAHYEDVPFTPLPKPLKDCRIALVTTGDVRVRGATGEAAGGGGEGMVGNAYSLSSDTPVSEIYSAQEHFDAHATHMDDVNAYFPLDPLRMLRDEGRFASLAPRCHGLFASYSIRKTLRTDAPEVLARCRQDEVDAVLLTPV